jgi:hypothetical protein
MGNPERAEFGYTAWCLECGRTTSHEFGRCLEHQPTIGFPRPAITLPTKRPVVGHDHGPKRGTAA